MKERLQLKKWLNGITNVLFCLCLLVVILIVLQVFVVTSFKIPSDSMEPSLLAGDCILVDKCSGGAISEGDKYSINPDMCTECGTCADVCPSEAISQG